MSFDPRFINSPFRTEADIAGLKVTVMGLGLNGGGVASARFFASRGALVTVTDGKGEKDLAPSIEALSDLPNIRFVLGRHENADFSGADTVIKNPGVKLEGNPYLSLAASIETDISTFLRLSAAPLIAVTGSKGKSSTVSALHFGLAELGYRAFLGGNITVSPLSFLDETGPDTPVVLELSSWQLADLRGRGLLKPRVAILTPVMPDHQNWYGGMEPYVADKKLIYADMGSDTHLICSRDDEWGPVFARETAAQAHWYSAKPFADEAGAWLEADGTGWMRRTDPSLAGSAVADSSADAGVGAEPGNPVRILNPELAVPGFHMRQNLLNAAQAIVLFGADPEKTAEALSRFSGIKHRLELFHEEAGTRWYNDSAATIPEAVAAALGSFERPVVLLTGGTDKNLHFAPLAAVASRAKKIILLAGTGTDKLIPLLRERGIAYDGPHPDLKSLVAAARSEAEPGDVVLFSPGATSFGMFRNEFDRGDKFRSAVTEK